MQKTIKKGGMKHDEAVLNTVLHILFVIMSVVFIYPILLTLAISFTDEATLANYGYSIWPQKWSLDGYRFALSGNGIVNAYKVTIAASVCGTLLSVFIMLLYAYPLSRKDFKHRTGFTFYAYFTTLFSGGLVPWYIVCTKMLHLNNTFWALFVPSLVGSFNILILRTFIKGTIPFEIIESAKIDGSSEFGIFFKMIIPLSKAGIATIGLFQLLGYWNDYYLPMMLITNKNLFNLQYYLQSIFLDMEALTSGQYGSAAMASAVNIPKETTRFAMCVLTMGPILIVYPFFQKYFVQGLTVGAVKG